MEELIPIFLLILAAMVLAILEICTPSFGILALGGFAALVASLVLSFRYAMWFGWLMTVLAIVFTPVYIAFLIRLFPKTPLGKRLFLAKAESGQGEATPEEDKFETMLGKSGTADTLLRPAGMVIIDNQRIPARAERGMIEKGTPVRVINHDSMNVIVEAVQE